MGSFIQLTKSTSAYEVKPENAKAGLVIIQEIFGVNSHIRGVCEEYGLEGYQVLAPALFDPAEKSVELPYDPSSFAKGRELAGRIGWERALEDINSAVVELKKSHKQVSVMGFCWGGSLAFLAACRLKGIYRAVSFYGSKVFEFRQELPVCPVLFHFGESDPSISMNRVEEIKRIFSHHLIFTYKAGHGFNCNLREDFNPEAAALAKKRTLQFLEGSFK
jgi:carboxymethylenebutenolidase